MVVSILGCRAGDPSSKPDGDMGKDISPPFCFPVLWMAFYAIDSVNLNLLPLPCKYNYRPLPIRNKSKVVDVNLLLANALYDHPSHTLPSRISKGLSY